MVPFPATDPTLVQTLFEDLWISNPELFLSEEVVQFNVTSLLFMKDVKDANSTGRDKIKDVSFVNVQKGKRLVLNMDLETDDTRELEEVSETISLKEIVRIRSSK